MIKFADEKKSMEQIVAAMNSGDEKQIQQAWADFHASVVAQIKADFEELQESNDATILAQRGYRQLTAKENKWYQKVITALKSPNPKQAFTAIIGSENEDDLMPTTIIEDVYKNLKEEHPLLSKINFQHVKYATKWILNDHSAQNAVWGTITDEITKEITSSFKTVDIKQNKLSAWAVIENGMLDLGPVWMDAYIRTVLKEAMLAGFELAIVDGTGVNQPVGLTRNISKDVSYNSQTGYPRKDAVALTSFTPAEYGSIIATMALTEDGKMRKFSKVCMVVNMVDYLTKIMPATTVLNTNGGYVRDLFPFPTDVVVSNVVETGKAIVFLPEEYFLGVGGDKSGVIEYSDEYKFLEDQRVFRIKQYGEGRAYDNTAAVYLDISNLDPAYITVKNIAEVTA